MFYVAAHYYNIGGCDRMLWVTGLWCRTNPVDLLSKYNFAYYN